MMTYQTLFIRAKNVLKKRYDIDLNVDSSLSWLTLQVSEIFDIKKKVEPGELKPLLHTLRRQNPTKFYLLEQELINYIRKENKKPTIRKINPVEEIDLNKVQKKKDDDFEPPSDASGYIYS